jgi:hypothetical protein
VRAEDAVCQHPYALIRQLEQEVQVERRRVLERTDAELTRARAEACALEAQGEDRARSAADEIRRRAERESDARVAAIRAESAAALADLERRAEVDREAALAAMARLIVGLDAGDGVGGRG